MIYDHKDPATMKKYAIRYFPTFIVTDAAGTEMMRKVGAPFSTPEDAAKWFPRLATAFDEVSDLEARYEESPESTKVERKLAATYAVLARADEAAELYDTLVKKLDENSPDFKKNANEYAEGYTSIRKSKEAAALYDRLVSRLDEKSKVYLEDVALYAKGYAGIRKYNEAEKLYDILLARVDKKS